MLPRCLVLLVLLLACGGPPTSTATQLTSSPLTVEASFERSPLTRTQNVLRIHLSDANGADVSAAEVRVTLSMPSHGHTAPGPMVTAVEGGDYQATVNFTMPGTWDVVVTAAKEAHTGGQRIAASAP